MDKRDVDNYNFFVGGLEVVKILENSILDITYILLLRNNSLLYLYHLSSFSFYIA